MQNLNKNDTKKLILGSILPNLATIFYGGNINRHYIQFGQSKGTRISSGGIVAKARQFQFEVVTMPKSGWVSPETGPISIPLIYIF